MANHEIDKALENYREALTIHQQRAQSNPTDSNAQSRLAAYHQRIAVACRNAGRFDEALEHMRQAVSIAEELASKHASNIAFQIMRVTFYHSLGTLEQSRQQFGEAYAWYDRGLTLSRELANSGKLVGDEAAWPKYIEDSIQTCREAEKNKPAQDAPQSNTNEPS